MNSLTNNIHMARKLCRARSLKKKSGRNSRGKVPYYHVLILSRFIVRDTIHHFQQDHFYPFPFQTSLIPLYIVTGLLLFCSHSDIILRFIRDRKWRCRPKTRIMRWVTKTPLDLMPELLHDYNHSNQNFQESALQGSIKIFGW